MEISPTGSGLNILIKCDYTLQHDWMVFASWYSCLKMLPDAKVRIICARRGFDKIFFNWPLKCQVPFIQYSKKEKTDKQLVIDLGVFKETDEFIVITPETMAVYQYDKDNVGPTSAKTDENSTFVNYLDGCGKFVNYEWINKSPFNETEKLYSDDLKLNEYRILKIWEKCHSTYMVIA